MTRFLVTGASGFIGRHLTLKLSGSRNEVFGISRSTGSNTPNVKFVSLDLCDRDSVDQYIEHIQPDIIVHLAATTGKKSQIECSSNLYQKNLEMSENLVTAAQKLDCLKHFIFLGSCEEYGAAQTPFSEGNPEKPVTPYGSSKLLTSMRLQKLAKKNGFPATILRPSVVYGPGQAAEMFIPGLLRALSNDMPVDMTEGKQSRDFVFVDDVVTAIFKIATSEVTLIGQKYNIASGASHKIIDVARRMEEILDVRGLDLLRVGMRPYRPNEIMDYSVDVTAVWKRFGWRAQVSLSKGLEKTAQYFEAND